jgi:hypothetical protein
MYAAGSGVQVLERGAGYGEIEPIEPIAGAFTEAQLHCVSSDLQDECSCHAGISRAVVERAWRRELEASGDHEGRFFHLIHDDGVWQAYGLGNGQVRGVYCPAHNSQRAARSRAAVCDAGDIVYELALAA